MPNVTDEGSPNLGTLRSGSPVNISTESSGRTSLKAIHPEESEEPEAPHSPLARLTRKRAASLNTETANLPPRIGDLALNSATSGGPSTPELTREQVCLCQPDPKIPRPRNAFILYRQHYQAQVVAQHPGLANPDISKIIGEQWRQQTAEVKSDWKRLAEEEKQRHQRQYPGYRYQPRRAGKPNGVGPVSTVSSENPIRCPKCSGRYISTSNTPLTPFTPTFGQGHRNDLHPPFTPTAVSRTIPLEIPRYSSQIQTPGMDSPRNGPPHQQAYRRAPYPHPQPLQTHREQDEDMDLLITSPDQKRRRFNEPQNHRGYASSSPVSFSAPQPFSRNGAPLSATGYRQQQLPGPGMLHRQGNMGPPPQQSPMMQPSRNQYPNHSSAFDGSLRLPPLQTQISNSEANTGQRLDQHVDGQARSVEAMVMNIPYVNKIKLLWKISPPLKFPGPASPSPQTRGVVVAVEGADKALVAEIGSFINEYLRKEPSCSVQTWAHREPMSSPPSANAADIEMTESSSPQHSVLTSNGDPFVDYHSIISEWHKKSPEIIKYITSTPPQPTVNPNDISPVVQPSEKILPVALMPRGFSLTISDEFALRIPIMDSYAPVDHWQWMATLWRGIVGPDLTIYAKRVNVDEMERIGGVEMRGDCQGIIVRVLETEKMNEKTARRLGFEIMEIVRGIENMFETRHRRDI